jgi:SAM-dependent methyltransferase
VTDDPYYRPDLARIHHLGFGFHAEACAPGMLRLLEPIRERGGVVLEIGCGSGLLTRYLTDAGHRVIATDASPAMLDLARAYAPDAEEIRRLTLPDDPVSDADAIVGIGHALSYLPDESSLDRALIALADAVRPGGLLAIDLCDLAWLRDRRHQRAQGWVGDDWGLITKTPYEGDDRFIREMTMFTKNPDGNYRRTFERHHNVLTDTSRIPALLAERGLEAEIRQSFGDEQLPDGLVVVLASRPS